MSNVLRYEIVSGPSLFEFATRYFDRNLQTKAPFKFTIQSGVKRSMRDDVFVILNDIAYEDGTGTRWNISGFAVNVGQALVTSNFHNFSGFYDSSRRKGFFEFKVS